MATGPGIWGRGRRENRENPCDGRRPHSSFRVVNAATEGRTSFRSAPHTNAPLGAFPVAGGTRFRVFARRTDVHPDINVRIVDARGTPLQMHALTAAGDGIYETTVPGVGHGTLYQFVVGDRELPDPFARFLPFGVHGPAMVIEPRYRWSHGEGVLRSLREQVLYELHIGTFTEAGTYAAARARLGEVAALGVTTIQLLPLASFPGSRGWGYDGVAPFAPFSAYGEPDELRAFVDEAHRLGLSVLLDVVYNHFGPSGNYLGAYSPEYFTRDLKSAWGDAPDFRRAPMRRLVIENALYWLQEFRFDGLRLDATHAIIDPSPRHILRELADRVASLRPRKLLIAEDDRNDPGLIRQHGLDAIWADDFHHALRVTLTGERDGYYACYEPGVETLAETIRRGWWYTGQRYPLSETPRGKPADGLPAEAFIYCIQNHDQIGNRALGDRLSAAVSPEAYRAASALLLFLPMTPLLFMGQEWAATTPFQYFTDHDPELGRLVSRGRREEFKHFEAFRSEKGMLTVPDPQDGATFSRSRLNWDERTQPDHARTLELYRRLIALRRNDPVLREAGRDALAVDTKGGLLVLSRWSSAGERCLVLNLGKTAQPLAAAGVRAAHWELLLSTDGHGPAPAAPDQLAPQTAEILARRHHPGPPDRS